MIMTLYDIDKSIYRNEYVSYIFLKSYIGSKGSRESVPYLK